MDISIIQDYLATETLILVAALWVLGVFLKKTPVLPDWSIVWILMAIGIIASLLLVEFDINGVIQGVLATGVAVLGYDLFKQAKKAVEEK